MDNLNQESDFLVKSYGETLFTVQPLTEAAHQWVKDYILCEETLCIESAIVVEHIYIDQMIKGIQEDGMSVKEL